MATKQFYATGDFRHPRYRTRMLRAGDPVELTTSEARLYDALGKISSERPKSAVTATPADDEAPKRTPRKKAAKKTK